MRCRRHPPPTFRTPGRHTVPGMARSPMRPCLAFHSIAKEERASRTKKAPLLAQQRTSLFLDVYSDPAHSHNLTQDGDGRSAEMSPPRKFQPGRSVSSSPNSPRHERTLFRWAEEGGGALAIAVFNGNKLASCTRHELLDVHGTTVRGVSTETHERFQPASPTVFDFTAPRNQTHTPCPRSHDVTTTASLGAACPAVRDKARKGKIVREPSGRYK